jgi:hypothetical protein
MSENWLRELNKPTFPGTTARKWKRRFLKVVVFNIVVSRETSELHTHY